MDDKVKAYLAFASVSFFWGTTYLAIRIGVAVMPPAMFAGVRFFMAGAVLTTILLLRGYRLPAWREWKVLAVIGTALLVMANGSVVWAEQYLPSSLMALIVATLPFSMVAIEALVRNGETLSIRKIAGILIGFLGLVLLLWPDLVSPTSEIYLPGLVVALLAPIFWSAGSVYSKHHRLQTPPLMAAAIQMLIAGVILTTIGVLAGELPSFSFSKQGLGAMLYLAVFGSIVGYGSYIYALDKLAPAVVSMYAYLNPVVAVCLGWFILDERLDLTIALGTVIILSGVMLVKTDGFRKRRTQPKVSSLTASPGVSSRIALHAELEER